MNIVLLTSWNPDGSAGSGMITAIRGVRDCLHAAGEGVGLICPHHEGQGYLTNTSRRIIFNHRLRPAQFNGGDVIAGFDFDGYALPALLMKRFVHVNGGVLADVVQFERGSTRLILRHLARLEARAARRAARVIVPSFYAGGAVSAYYDIPVSKIEVIPFGIDLARWGSSPNQPAGAPSRRPDGPVILGVAKFYPRKGVTLLLEAFTTVAGAVPGARLEIAGSGLQQHRIERAIESHPFRQRITLLGEIPHAEIPAVYRRATVFCLPSLHETFGFVFLEAMAAALPVVAFDCSAVPEMVLSGQTGWLAPQGDVSALARRLIELLRDPVTAAQMGAAGQRRAAQYTWARTAEGYCSVFQKVIKQ